MCLYVALGLVFPRVSLALLCLFRPEWAAAVRPWWLGVLGFLVVPFTTLAYLLIHAASGDVSGLGHLVILLVALTMDLGIWKGRKGRDGASVEACAP